MKSILDFIKLCEETVSTNTVSSGAIADKEVPLGKVQKRKVEETIGPGDGNPTKPLGDTGEDDPNPLGTTVGQDPLATVYAPAGKGPGDGEGQCDDAEMHLRKQQYQNDQMI